MEFTIYDDDDVAPFLEGLEERPQRKVLQGVIQFGFDSCLVSFKGINNLIFPSAVLQSVVDGITLKNVQPACACSLLLSHCQNAPLAF